jgi:hypothetical protein
VVFSLLGYFVCMIIVLTAAVGAMVGLSSFSTSEGVRHYPRPALEYSRPVPERNITGPNSEPRLFMSVPKTKEASPAKNVDANSVAATDENVDAKKVSRTGAKFSPISATTTSDLATRMYWVTPKNSGTGHRVRFPTGDHRIIA